MKGLLTFPKLLWTLIAPTIAATLMGCHQPPDCNFSREPTFALHIQNTLNYTSANALKNNAPLEGYDNNYTLPIAMNDSSTTYVFHAGAVTDTLELEYTKDVRFESKDCGFTLMLENLHVGSLTSFSSVEIHEDKIHIQ